MTQAEDKNHEGNGNQDELDPDINRLANTCLDRAAAILNLATPPKWKLVTAKQDLDRARRQLELALDAQHRTPQYLKLEATYQELTDQHLRHTGAAPSEVEPGEEPAAEDGAGDSTELNPKVLHWAREGLEKAASLLELASPAGWQLVTAKQNLALAERQLALATSEQRDDPQFQRLEACLRELQERYLVHTTNGSDPSSKPVQKTAESVAPSEAEIDAAIANSVTQSLAKAGSILKAASLAEWQLVTAKLNLDHARRQLDMVFPAQRDSEQYQELESRCQKVEQRYLAASKPPAQDAQDEPSVADTTSNSETLLMVTTSLDNAAQGLAQMNTLLERQLVGVRYHLQQARDQLDKATRSGQDSDAVTELRARHGQLLELTRSINQLGADLFKLGGAN